MLSVAPPLLKGFIRALKQEPLLGQFPKPLLLLLGIQIGHTFAKFVLDHGVNLYEVVLVAHPNGEIATAADSSLTLGSANFVD